jgi:hypothetical protein
MTHVRAVDRGWLLIPQPTFFKLSLSLSVSNYLTVSQEPDHDVTLVDAIVEHLRTYAITPGYDIVAYWRPRVPPVTTDDNTLEPL